MFFESVVKQAKKKRKHKMPHLPQKEPDTMNDKKATSSSKRCGSKKRQKKDMAQKMANAKKER